MSNPLEFLDTAGRLVIKIGSALLVDAASGTLRQTWLAGVAQDVQSQIENGKTCVVVSSGAIALGSRRLGLTGRTLTLEQSQAAAAVGQIQLAQAYEALFSPLGIKTAQVLLTLEDRASRRRFLNSQATLRTLLDHGVVPIVNENDTVATDEIRFGDNDRLAAHVASMVDANLLVLLSDVDGIYTSDPRQNPEAKRLSIVKSITPEVEAMAGDAGTGLAKGGMKTKVMAAKIAMESGCAMVITQGDVNRPLSALRRGANASWFLPNGDPTTARKRWIASLPPKGFLTIDSGAADALMKHASLLPAGLLNCEGEFERGDAVAVLDDQGQELGRGLVNYAAQQTRIIQGRHSSEIEMAVGFVGDSCLVHRDNLAINIEHDA